MESHDVQHDLAPLARVVRNERHSGLDAFKLCSRYQIFPCWELAASASPNRVLVDDVNRWCCVLLGNLGGSLLGSSCGRSFQGPLFVHSQWSGCR
jgi:hypothetical protein